MELKSIKDVCNATNFTKNQLRHFAKTSRIKKVGLLYCIQSAIEYKNSLKIVNLPNEVWKEIPHFSRYMASSKGRVKSKGIFGGMIEGIIKPALNYDGYYKSVFLADNGKNHNTRIHRLIALAFYPNDNWQNLEVNHINGIKTDNSIENLEWCTREENKKHCIDNHLQRVLIGEEVGNSILKEWQVKEIREKFKPRVYTRKMLSIEYGVDPCTIKDVILRRSWKHI
jgi:hypothetical protein